MINDYKKKIISFYKAHKRMPVYTEIMSLLGFKSKNAVSKLIDKLINEGVLDKDSSGHLIPNKLIGEVPLLGLVEAGFPSVAEEIDLNMLNLDDYLIDDKDDINPEWLEDVDRIGVTAGASAPERLVEGVIQWMQERWDISFYEMEGEEKKVYFKPAELIDKS